MRYVVHFLSSCFLWTKHTSYGPTVCGYAELERLAKAYLPRGTVYEHEKLTLNQYPKYQLNIPLSMSYEYPRPGVHALPLRSHSLQEAKHNYIIGFLGSICVDWRYITAL